MDGWYKSLNFDQKYAISKKKYPNIIYSRKSKASGTNMREWVALGLGYHFSEDKVIKKRDKNGKQVIVKQFIFAKTLESVYDLIYNHYTKEQRCVYEVISDSINPIKIFFDIDFKCKNDPDIIKENVDIVDKTTTQMLAFVKRYLFKHFGYEGRYEPQILYSDVCLDNEYKISRHIIVDGPDLDPNILYLKKFVKEKVIPFVNQVCKLDFVDTSVYSPWRNFRLVLNSKVGKNNFLKFGTKEMVDFETWKRLLINIHEKKAEVIQLSTGVESERCVRVRKKQQHYITLSHPVLRNWIRTTVLPFIGERDNAVCGVPTRFENSITIRCDRYKPCQQCFVSKSCNKAGSHASNGFAINIHLLPGTIYMFCHGSSGHPDGGPGEVRLHLKIPDTILSQFRIKEPSGNPIDLDISEKIFLEENCDFLGYEIKDSGTFYYYKKRVDVFCCSEIIEVLKKNHIKAATWRCLECNFKCSI